MTVLPNPYAVEYGRFSSGLVLINTRRATDVWKTRINKLDPSLRTTRGNPFDVVGISSFSPRFETGGPLIKDRVFLQQAAQYRYRSSDVASRPQSELRTSNRFSSFTRVDANLSPKHLLIAAGGWFPAECQAGDARHVHAAGRDGRHAAAASAPGRSRSGRSGATSCSPRRRPKCTATRHGVAAGIAADAAAARDDARQLLQSAASLDRDASVDRDGVRHASHRNRIAHVQGRRRPAAQPVSRHERQRSGVRPPHRRDAGAAARLRPTPTREVVNSTDLAVFAQDRVQPTSRLYVEFGGRLDRDGVIDRFNLTPRVGAAVLLNPAGTSVLRSGYGVFYERTPSVAGAYERVRSAARHAVRRRRHHAAWAADALHAHHGAESPDVAQRHVGRGSRSPAQRGLDAARRRHRPEGRARTPPRADDDRRSGRPCLLQSDGRSRYREGEISAHYTGGPSVDLNLSYVYSQARADLNAFTNFFDNVLAAGGRRERIRAGPGRRAAPLPGARPRVSAAQLAAGRGARLAERFAVLCRQ